jgi:hypothetical protein
MTVYYCCCHRVVNIDSIVSYHEIPSSSVQWILDQIMGEEQNRLMYTKLETMKSW